jgi:hypothetical protein
LTAAQPSGRIVAVTVMSASATSRAFMTGSAAILGLAALALIFGSDVVLAAAGAPVTAAAVVIAQLYGAALAGLATASWVSRNALLGGIFGRAVVAGGATHGLIGALTLGRELFVRHGFPVTPVACVALVAYASLACGFLTLMFGPTPSAP